MWNKIEGKPREKIAQIQLKKRLQETVTRVYELTSFYKDKFDELGISPKDITSLDDIQKITIYKKNKTLEITTLLDSLQFQ